MNEQAPSNQKVAQETIDLVCAGGGSQSERDAVWNYIRGLHRDLEDAKAELSTLEGVHAETLKLLEPALEPPPGPAAQALEALEMVTHHFWEPTPPDGKVWQEQQVAKFVNDAIDRLRAAQPPEAEGALINAVWELADDSEEDPQTGDVTIAAANWELLMQAIWDSGEQNRERLRNFGWEPPALTKGSTP